MNINFRSNYVVQRPDPISSGRLLVLGLILKLFFDFTNIMNILYIIQLFLI